MPTLFHLSHEQLLDALQGHLRRAKTITPELMADVIARACLRVQVQHPAAKASVFRLIESGAFADASLTLLGLELPQWKLRRLIYEDGEWHCALSQKLALPAELDDMAEGSHESLPLAMLSAFVEAQRSNLSATGRRPSSVPQVRPVRSHVVCCDNFR
jgi:hypothetical protein